MFGDRVASKRLVIIGNHRCRSEAPLVEDSFPFPTVPTDCSLDKSLVDVAECERHAFPSEVVPQPSNQHRITDPFVISHDTNTGNRKTVIVDRRYPALE
jgi:hypothetical protein